MRSVVLRRCLGLGFCLALLSAAAETSGPQGTFAPHEEEGGDHAGGEGDPAIAAPAALGATACRDGFAGPYPCRGVD
ncbi:MAG: hypothetical protein ACRD2T_03680, partial [Thermoanaerobaculia bacterium]